MTWGVEDLTVRYGGQLALDGVSVGVPPGSVTAVVGGDGAGKSTLLRVVTGLVPPDGGEVHRPALRRIGAMAEVPGIWADLTVDEHLSFVADAYGLDPVATDDRATRLLRRADLTDARHRQGGALSGGMRQKLAVVLALLHEPELLVLDEPTTGVDPVSRAELWRLIGHAAADGTGVLLSTTYLDEAERVAEVLVLDRGRSLLRGDPEEITGGRRLEEVVIERQRDEERKRARSREVAV
ncbi:MAG: ABC transporter ATP-binding protein [Nitriliruptorales bacterium]|nr:ABC transporter ATP-binding protein [Nitriliruptorales bacterium]